MFSIAPRSQMPLRSHYQPGEGQTNLTKELAIGLEKLAEFAAQEREMSMSAPIKVAVCRARCRSLRWIAWVDGTTACSCAVEFGRCVIGVNDILGFHPRLAKYASKSGA
jgi:hypothetical protein